MDKVLLNRKGKPFKIALIGGARTGKDTIAHYLKAVADFKRIAFGDALKKQLFEVFPDLPHTPKPRKAMIDFGQFCRTIDPLVWIKHLDQTAFSYERSGYHNIVITDVRQQNEIDYCRANGYTIVKVVANASTCKERALEGGEILEVNNELDILALNFKDYDYLIENSGTVANLYEQIDHILQNG